MCLEIFSSETGHIWIYYRDGDVHFLEETRHGFRGERLILLEEQKKHVTYKTRSIWDSFQSQESGKCSEKSVLAIFHVSL